MFWDQLGIYLYENPEIIAGVAAAVGLVFAARILVHQQKMDQIKLIESVFKDARELQREYATELRKPQMPDPYGIDFESFKSDWDSRFFNTVEWLSFLINEREVRLKKLIRYFKPSIIGWYEELFLRHAGDAVINDPEQYEEFKKLYKRLKNDSSPSIFRMKHEI